MRVKCKIDNLNSISDEVFKKNVSKEIQSPKGRVHLTVNKLYTVYAIEFWNNQFPRFLICDDRYPKMNYPLSYLGDFFEIENSRLSKYWKFGIQKSENGYIHSMISFKEMVDDPTFFEKLIDGIDSKVLLFQKYKKLIDDEEI